MKSRTTIPVLLACCGLALGACTGLQQFPEVSEDYSGDLTKQDPAYDTALTAINAQGADGKKIRNEEIDRRLRVIDLNFSEFRRGLATESVAADFGVAVVQLGLGGAGALVSQTASQILSAVSGGLAGTQQAYSKAALYEKTVSALIAQMIASRKTILVNILTGRTQDIDKYPLSAAVLDLEAYQYAGSLPGAVLGTAADAKVKEVQADMEIERIVGKFKEDGSSITIRKWLEWDGTTYTNTTKLEILEKWIKDNNINGNPSVPSFLKFENHVDSRAQFIIEKINN